MRLMRRLLDRVRRRLVEVPEYSRANSVWSLALGCLMVALGAMSLLMTRDHVSALLHFSVGLVSFIDAVKYALPDRRRRAKVGLKITEILVSGAGFILFSSYLIIYYPRGAWLSLAVLGPVGMLILALVLYLEYEYRRQKRSS